MKRMMRTTISGLLGCLLFTTVGCSFGSPGAEASAAPTEREVRALRDSAEPGAPATEYVNRSVTLRLFGTQGTREFDGASATLADTANFATTSYHVGETVGRNLKLTAIQEDSIELVDLTTGTRRTVLAGQDFTVRLVEHEFDRAALDQGQHEWTLRGRIMAKLAARYGLGGTATAMAQPFGGMTGLKIGTVDGRGVLGRLGLQAGDLLLLIDGQAASRESLATLSARFAESKSQSFMLTIARGGNLWEAAYVVE